MGHKGLSGIFIGQQKIKCHLDGTGNGMQYLLGQGKGHHSSKAESRRSMAGMPLHHLPPNTGRQGDIHVSKESWEGHRDHHTGITTGSGKAKEGMGMHRSSSLNGISLPPRRAPKV